MKRVLALILAAFLLCAGCPVFASAEQTIYQVGDRVEDFSVTLPDGTETTLYGILESHEMVILDFFYVGCIWCEVQFAFMEEAYRSWGGDAEILSITRYDSLRDIQKYQSDLNLTFPMARDWDGSIHDRFGVEYYPNTFVVDRNGILCMELPNTAFSPKQFDAIHDVYAADDYAEPRTDFQYPQVFAGDLGCPVAEDPSAVILTFEPDKAQEIPVAEDGVSCWLTEEGAQTVHIKAGSQVDLMSTEVINADETACLLIDLPFDEEGFILTSDIPMGLSAIEVYDNEHTLALACLVSDLTYAHFVEPLFGITLAEEDASYAISIVDQDGLPVEGVMISVCDADTCRNFTSDADGMIRFTAPRCAYEVHLLKLPDGCAADLSEIARTDPNGGKLELIVTRESAEN